MGEGRESQSQSCEKQKVNKKDEEDNERNHTQKKIIWLGIILIKKIKSKNKPKGRK